MQKRCSGGNPGAAQPPGIGNGGGDPSARPGSPRRQAKEQRCGGPGTVGKAMPQRSWHRAVLAQETIQSVEIPSVLLRRETLKRPSARIEGRHENENCSAQVVRAGPVQDGRVCRPSFLVDRGVRGTGDKHQTTSRDVLLHLHGKRRRIHRVLNADQNQSGHRDRLQGLNLAKAEILANPVVQID